MKPFTRKLIPFFLTTKFKFNYILPRLLIIIRCYSFLFRNGVRVLLGDAVGVVLALLESETEFVRTFSNGVAFP